MGLKSGNGGAKAYLAELIPQAFRTYPTLLDARLALADTTGADRAGTVAVVDGNVLMMQLPTVVVMPIADVVRIVWSSIEQAVGAARLVVVVFDEPAAMTLAKKAEQTRRDANRAARKVVTSVDLDDETPLNDFDPATLDAQPCVLKYRDHRPTRSRFYDEVCRRVMAIFNEKAAKWNASGKAANKSTLVFDGVDLAGATRPPDEARRVGIVGSVDSDDVVAALQRETPIGEGDIKIQYLDRRVRELAQTDENFQPVKLIISCTIDTDSLLIGTLGVARRRMEPPPPVGIASVLAMRTPATKAQKQIDEHTAATFLVVDIVLLEAHMQAHIWKTGVQPTNEQMLNAMIATAASAALAGCDFVELGGARFDHFFDAMNSFVRTEPLSLDQFARALKPDPVVAQQITHPLLRICYNASTSMEAKPRYKRQAKSVYECDRATLLRAAWTAAYWCEVEHVADAEWGFPVFELATSDDVAGNPASSSTP